MAEERSDLSLVEVDGQFVDGDFLASFVNLAQSVDRHTESEVGRVRLKVLTA